MTDTKREIGKKGQSGDDRPYWLDAIVRSRSEGYLERKKLVEEGPYHPSEQLLWDYLKNELDEDEGRIVAEHLALCGPCSRECFRLSCSLVDERPPLLTRAKELISQISLHFDVLVPASYPVRGDAQRPDKHVFTPGTCLVLKAVAPADGYLTIFHACEETGKVKLIFPLPGLDHDPHVLSGEVLRNMEGLVDGPSGKHLFKVFWTRNDELELVRRDLGGEGDDEEAVELFLDALEELPEEDWQEVTYQYEVVRG